MQPQATDLGLSEADALYLVDYFKDRPEELYEKILGTKPWDIQVEILKSVFKYRETTVKSCHGTGKSFNAARIALAFLLTHPGCIVVTTAPTWRQVEDVLWRELRSAFNKARVDLGGHLTKTGLNMDDDWYAIGLSTTEPDKFQGYHSDDVLVIVDEAAGIEEPIYEGIRAITSNQNAHVLYIGNPTTLDGTFYKSFQNPRANKFSISAFQTPNFTANGITSLEKLIETFTPPQGVAPIDWEPITSDMLPYPALVAPQWAYERYLEWGVDTAMWAARVMGEFPSQANDALISLQACLECMQGTREYLYDEQPGLFDVRQGPPEYGADIARFGDDRTVIAPRRGGWVEPLKVYSHLPTDIVADRIVDLIDLSNWNTIVRIDDGNMGGGVTDALRRYLRTNRNAQFNVVAINFGSASIESKRLKKILEKSKSMKMPVEERKAKFANRRAEMFWNLRDLINARKIILPHDEELANELASIRYTYRPDGSIIIEPKEKMKLRTGKSPDKADALALAFANMSATEASKPRSTVSESPLASRTIINTSRGIGKPRPSEVAAAQGQRPATGATIMGGINRRY